jgi:predicted ATPase/DNA-binding winged helix-turn-helix (wHTH) protein
VQTDTEDSLRFGQFELRQRQRMLLAGGVPVALGSRAFDILCALIDDAGKVISKEELVAKVWPSTYVVEGSLRVHMAGLRKALGDGRNGQRYIVNIPMRGYSFVAPIARAAGTARADPAPSVPRHGLSSLPTPLHRIVGRDQDAATLREHLVRHRLVTLVGAAGIGKTTLAVSIAATLGDAPQRTNWLGVRFVDLGLLSDPHLVAVALASTLGIASLVDDALPSLLAFLHDKALLILFDNCEHVLVEAAALAEAILRGAPGVRILATSREPLRADGEWVHHLQPLAVPDAQLTLTAETAMSYSAVELFVERALGLTETFELRETDVPAIAEICRRLDGLPLALELAAPRLDTLGVGGLAAALDNRFALLTTGRRTALPRHQTLRAALDWSFDLLDARDQDVLQRLSIFAGSFTLDAASAVAAADGLDAFAIVESLSDLVARSLVAPDVSRDETRFRLLETTRVYAREKLALGRDGAPLARRHAAYCLDRLEWGEANWSSSPAADWLAVLGGLIDDVRAALAWAFAPAGDAGLGLELTVKSAPLFFQLSLADEYRQHAQRALDRASRMTGVPAVLDFKLNLVFGYVVFHTLGLHPDTRAAFDRAQAIAAAAGDDALLALAYSAKWMGAYNRGEPARMMEFAQRFETLTQARPEPAVVLMYDRMKSATFHFLGDQRSARDCAERSLRAANIRTPFLMGSQIDRRISVGTILGRVLWLQGDFAAAEACARQTVDLARQEGESVAYAFALAFCACPVAIWNGNIALARERVALLMRHAAERALAAWGRWGTYYDQFLAGLDDAGTMHDLSARVRADPPATQLLEILATFDPALATDAAFARGADGSAGWCAPELLRLEAARTADPQLAEDLLRQSIADARAGGAVAWALRSTSSLAEFLAARGRAHEAAATLTEGLAGLSEALEIPDLTRAKALLAILPAPGTA